MLQQESEHLEPVSGEEEALYMCRVLKNGPGTP